MESCEKPAYDSDSHQVLSYADEESFGNSRIHLLKSKAMGMHRSFQISPNPQLINNRVVPRLLITHRVLWIARVIAIVGSMSAFVILCKNVEMLDPSKNVAVAVLWFLIPAATDYLTFWAGRRVAFRLGFLHQVEYDAYQRFMYCWPENWLEDRRTVP